MALPRQGSDHSGRARDRGGTPPAQPARRLRSDSDRATRLTARFRRRRHHPRPRACGGGSGASCGRLRRLPACPRLRRRAHRSLRDAEGVRRARGEAGGRDVPYAPAAPHGADVRRVEDEVGVGHARDAVKIHPAAAAPAERLRRLRRRVRGGGVSAATTAVAAFRRVRLLPAVRTRHSPGGEGAVAVGAAGDRVRGRPGAAVAVAAVATDAFLRRGRHVAAGGRRGTGAPRGGHPCRAVCRCRSAARTRAPSSP